MAQDGATAGLTPLQVLFLVLAAGTSAFVIYYFLGPAQRREYGEKFGDSSADLGGIVTVSMVLKQKGNDLCLAPTPLDNTLDVGANCATLRGNWLQNKTNNVLSFSSPGEYTLCVAAPLKAGDPVEFTNGAVHCKDVQFNFGEGRIEFVGLRGLDGEASALCVTQLIGADSFVWGECADAYPIAHSGMTIVDSAADGASIVGDSGARRAAYERLPRGARVVFLASPAAPSTGSAAAARRLAVGARLGARAAGAGEADFASYRNPHPSLSMWDPRLKRYFRLSPTGLAQLI